MKPIFLTLAGILFSICSFGQIAPITGPTSMCIGTTITLADATPGGTWSSSAPVVATVSVSTGIVTAITPGIVTITYTVGASSVNTTITINAAPAPIAGTLTVPIGGTTTLSSATGGGIWSSSVPAVATVGSTSGVVTGVSMGTSFISYTIGTGCMTTTAVTVNTPGVYVVTGGGSFCSGSTGVFIGLSGSSTGYTYRLYFGGVPVGGPLAGTGSAISFGPWAGAGTYTVVATNTTTLATTAMSGSATITVNPIPTMYNVTGGGTYCAGGPGVHIGLDGSDGSVSYQMFNGASAVGGPIMGTGLSVDFGMQTASGIYAVIGTNLLTGCTSTMAGTVSVSSIAGMCSGAPTAGSATTSSGVACLGASVFLNSSGFSSCGLNYQWQGSPNNSTWTDITGATNSYYNVTPTGSTFYRYVVTCPSSGLRDNSASTSVTIHPDISAAYTIPVPDSVCGSTQLYIRTCTAGPSWNVTTFYGDGSSDNHTLTTTGSSYAFINHSYANPGTYSIKQVLYNGSSAVDSVTYAYVHTQCRVLPVQFYYDQNSNCINDTGDIPLSGTVMTAIDSNGVTIDSISSTSGFYYKARGPVGTIYAFRVTHVPGSMIFTCPATGIAYDTIQTALSGYTTKQIGLVCGSGVMYDLSASITTHCGRHSFNGDIYVANSYCSPTPPIVTMHFNPKYGFLTSTPAPTLVSGNTVTWNLSPVSTATGASHIVFWCERPGGYIAWLTPGDTVHTYLTVGPIASDIDTSNNVITKNDTVISSYDPNEMAVSPTGLILPCTQLQYTIQFQNTGNDTARNITVMDTLSDNVDVNTMNVVMASATMNVYKYTSSGHNILKFDFPNINLLDSSHHGMDEGSVVFNIKTKPGLTDGTTILNSAGIFFDDNPAVLTNVVENAIGMSAVTGQPSVCIGSNDTLRNNTTGGIWSLTNTHASMTTVEGACILTGVSAGTDTVKYTVTNNCGTRTMTKVVTINALPAAITGATHVCPTATATLSDLSTGGTWRNNNPSVLTIAPSTGVVSGVATGMDTITYTLPTGCAVTRAMSVDVQPAAFTVSGGGSYCAGDTGLHVLLGGSETGSNYQLYLGTTIAGSTVAGTGSALDMGLHTTAGTYTVIATNTTTSCTSNMSSSAVVNINPLPSVFTVTGGGAYCAGDTGVHIHLSGSTTGVNYQLYSGGAIGSPVAGTGSVLDLGLHTTAGIYTVIATDAATGCSKPMASSALITINPLPPTFATTGGGSYCAGGSGLPIGLSGSNSGMSYQLFFSGSPLGSPVAGTGLPLAFGSYSTAGTYTIVATNTSTSCTSTMAPVTIAINPLPATYTVTGGGNYCSADSGVHINLAGSDTGVTYRLYTGTVAYGAPMLGTGSSLDFGLVVSAGTYSVHATNGATTCTTTMGGVSVGIIPSVTPIVAITSSDADTVCTGTTVLYTANPTFGGSTPSYAWKVNNVVVGSGPTYNYTPLNGDIVKVVLNSSAICARPDTAAAVKAMTVQPHSIPVVTITASSVLIKPGQKDTLTATVGSCSSTPSYQWVINSTPVPGATNSIFISNTLYNKDSVSCMVNCAGPCGQQGFNTIVITVINIDAVHDPYSGLGNIDVFPNPNKGVFTVKGVITSAADELALSVTNMLGQTVYTHSIPVRNGTVDTQLSLDGQLARGVYMLTLRDGDGSRVVRLVVE